VYDENKKYYEGRNYAYKNDNTIMKIISSEDGSNKILVDSYADWSKGCYLAMGAKEDMSDIPSYTFVDGKVTEIRKIDEEHTEITLDKPLKKAINVGTAIRVHGKNGSNVFRTIKVLHPGEEETFLAHIVKDDRSFLFSSDVLPKGAFYIQPVILSYSLNDEMNSVLISDFAIIY